MSKHHIVANHMSRLNYVNMWECIIYRTGLFSLKSSYYHISFDILESKRTTVLPTKSDSDVMFWLHHYQGLIIDRYMCINLILKSYPEDRINTHVIYQFASDQVIFYLAIQV